MVDSMSDDNDTIWKPHVTVAAVVECDDRFLMVEEISDGTRAFNQPAGHLEPGEDLVSAMLRETLEESAWVVEPESFIGTYRWHNPANDTTYLRFAFSAHPLEHRPDQPLDAGIIAAHWLDIDQIREKRALHRGPQVMQCIEDYLDKQRFPLSAVKELSGL